MSDYELLIQLFALLLGLIMAEMLMGLARAWRIRKQAAGAAISSINVGWLVPLFGILLLGDLTHFWISLNVMKDYLAFDYVTILSMLLIIGSYFIISTFVFPDEPSDWPDFDDYFMRTNRIVVGGMIIVNAVIILFALSLVARGAPWETAPMARSWLSMGAAALYFPSLIALWFAKTKRANLALLLVANLLLIVAAVGSSGH